MIKNRLRFVFFLSYIEILPAITCAFENSKRQSRTVACCVNCQPLRRIYQYSSEEPQSIIVSKEKHWLRTEIYHNVTTNGTAVCRTVSGLLAATSFALSGSPSCTPIPCMKEHLWESVQTAAVLWGLRGHRYQYVLGLSTSASHCLPLSVLR